MGTINSLLKRTVQGVQDKEEMWRLKTLLRCGKDDGVELAT